MRQLIQFTTSFLAGTFLFAQTILAQGQAGPQPSFFETFVIPLLLIMGIMYFLVIRPQQRKIKALNTLHQNMKPGDEVYTTGGIVGKIKSKNDVFVQIESPSGALLKVLVQNIAGFSKEFQKNTVAAVKKKTKA